MSLPTDFISSVRFLLGNETELFLSALADDAPVSFRLNPLKMKRNQRAAERLFPGGHTVNEPAAAKHDRMEEECRSAQLRNGEKGDAEVAMAAESPLQRVPWSPWGFYLEKRPSFTFDPLFHTGYYYVQEASSMFIEHIIRRLVKHPATCLDLCAAPGGKSVSMLSALPGGSLLVSNETVRQRAHILSETIAKYGSPNVLVSNNPAKDFAALPHFFDLVLVDAPCSGEGMFRKDTTAIHEWSVRNVALCAARQREILNDVWPALKPGGLLVYSTCTYNTSENEENALWAAEKLGAEFVAVDPDPGWGISPSFDRRVTGYRFFPHKTKGEGLFVTVLKKADGDGMGTISGRAGVKGKKTPFSAGLLLHPDTFDFVETDNTITAIPAEHSEMLLTLDKKLKTVSMGIELGVRKGQVFIPSHRVAMNMELNLNAFPRHEASFDEAVAYLRREGMMLPGASHGYLLLTYKGEPLGFVKNLGFRANNLYPYEWRIRSQGRR